MPRKSITEFYIGNVMLSLRLIKQHAVKYEEVKV
jgi:hypothetical protein